jgi:hypothetical protein
METQQQTEILLTSLCGHRMLFPDWETAYLVVGSLYRGQQYRTSKVGFGVDVLMGERGCIAQMTMV